MTCPFLQYANPWGRFAKGQGQLPNRAKCPVFFLFTGDDLSWYGLNFQSSLLFNCLPDGGDSPPSTLRRNRSPRKLGQNTRERKKKTRVYTWQVPDDVYLPFCYTAKFWWILSCNNQIGIQTHFLWMELGFWVLLFFSVYSDKLTHSSNWTGPHKIVINMYYTIITLGNIY